MTETVPPNAPFHSTASDPAPPAGVQSAAQLRVQRAENLPLIDLSRPVAGDVATVELPRGHALKLNFELAEVTGRKVAGGNLELSFDDGGKVVLRHYLQLAEDDVPVLRKDGTATDFNALVLPTGQQQPEPPPEEILSGGHFYSQYDPGRLGDGLDHLGGLGDDDLTLGGFDRVDRVIPVTLAATTAGPVNAPPLAVDDTSVGEEDAPITIDVLGNDSDPNGDQVTVIGAGNGAHGTTSVGTDGQIVYTPDPDTFGTDSFVYTISDGNGGTATATVFVTVTGQADPPVAADDAGTTNEDTPLTVAVLANDSDADNDALTITAAGNGAHGTTTIGTDGQIVYTPDADFSGTDSFVYTITDGNGGTASATVTVTVVGVNDPPVAGDDDAATDEDTAVTVNVLANDSDVDGGPLTVFSSGPGAHGTTAIGTDGQIVYTPEADFSGTDSFIYTITDGNGGTASATVTVTVLGVNDPPVAADDSGSTNEETPITVDVLANDSDIDGGPLTVIAAGNGANGTTSIGTDGQIVYTPDVDFNGTDSFVYTITDGNGGTASATVTVTVLGVNDPPVAEDDSATTDEDNVVTIDVLGNDSDVDGGPLTVLSADAGAHGTTTVGTDGQIVYTPEADFFGTDSFVYTISDGNGGTATATVTVTVLGVNDPPVAADDAATTDEDTAVTIDVLANDSDIDGGPLTVAFAGNGAHGSTTIGTDGQIVYTPEAEFSGTDSFVYTVTDGNGGTASALVTVTVTGVNDPPVAGDDDATTDEDNAVTVNVLANDNDVDGGPLTVVSADAGAHGTTSVAPDGSIVYTPEADFFGTDSFIYTITDGNGGTASATVTVTVQGVNDPPVAADDTATTDEDTALTVNVLANDSDIDGGPLTVAFAGNGAHGTTSVGPGGEVVYTPEADFFGTDSFVYTITDGNGGTASATVTVTVTGVNDPPLAADDAATTDEDNVVTIDVLANDSDIDGGPLTVIGAGNGIFGNTSIGTDGQIVYTPIADFSGTDFFVYTISDGNGGTASATVTVTVTGVNDPPIARDDSTVTGEDFPVTIGVLGNDTDVDGGALTVTTAGNGAHGSTAIGTDGTVLYTPETNFFGTDSFTYTISDGNGGTASATVTVTVVGLNDPPLAGDDTATTDQDSPVTVAVLANDTDPDGDPLTVLGAENGAHGTTGVGTDGQIVYTPEADFFGTDSFVYTIVDGNGGGATATVTVTVTGNFNDPPVANTDGATTNEDTPVVIDVRANDADPDADPLTVVGAGNGAHGTTSIGSDGNITYTPEADFFGTDLFYYTISDGHGGTAAANVFVSVIGVNDAPVASDDTATVDEDSVVGVPVNVLLNDSDADGDPLTLIAFGAAAHGTMFASGGNIVYTPEANFFGTDSFIYTISDGNGATATATVTITVNGVNDAPTPVDDDATTLEATAVTVSVLANDSDPDGDPLTLTSAFGAAHGSVVVTGGTVIYTPDADFDGTDSFTYFVYDGNGGSTSATVTVTVQGVNEAPLANDDEAITVENVAVTVDVLANDSDPDGDTITLLAVENGSGGTTTIVGGQIVYTPDPDYDGVDTFVYTIGDGHGGTASATVTIGIEGVNGGPLAIDDDATTTRNTPFAIDVLNNDSDPDSDALQFVTWSSGSHGFVAYESGELIYIPNTDYVGTDSFTYTITDGNGGTASATVTVTVEGSNADPVALDDTATLTENTSVTVDVLANDSDPDGDTPTLLGVAGAGSGTTSIVGGQVVYTPFADFEGTDSFVYTIDDGNGGMATASVTVSVLHANDAPVAAEDAASSAFNASVTVDVLANDSDPDGDPLTVLGAGNGAGGTTSVESGLVVYTPNPGFTGTDSFSYTIDDGNGATALGTVVVTVNGPLGPIVAEDDAFSTFEGTPLHGNVSGNDTVVAGPGLYGIIAGASNGYAQLHADGSFDYTPYVPGSSVDTFVYLVVDHDGHTATATVTISVIGVNQPPDTYEDFSPVELNTPTVIDVLYNDGDFDDNDVLTLLGAGDGLHGHATVTTDGMVVYTPDDGFIGVDNFIYSVTDGNGGMATQTVQVWVTEAGVNNDPTAVDDYVFMRPDAPQYLFPLSGDFDINGDDLTIIGVSAAGVGTVELTSGFDVRYEPNPAFEGTDSFIYTISDGNGGMATASFLISLGYVNTDPVANDDDSNGEGSHIPIQSNELRTINILGNDYDSDNDPLTLIGFDQPAHGTVLQTPDGQVSYLSSLDYNGIDEFTYTISDGNGGMATAHVVIDVYGGVVQEPMTDDFLLGTDDIDYLAGDLGIDTMLGRGGGDWFHIGAMGPTNYDRILDFNLGEGDNLDISALITDYVTDATLDNFVQFVENGGNTQVMVSANGQPDQFQIAAVLVGVTGLDPHQLLQDGHLFVPTM